MRILFVHQGFPSQFCHLAPHLAAQPGNEVLAVGEKRTLVGMSGAPATEAAAFRPVAPGVKLLGYELPPEPGPGIDAGLRRAIQRGLAVAAGSQELARSGFQPDVIFAYPAWGEALFLKDVFPRAKLVLYCETYLRAPGTALGFDPEFPPNENAPLHWRVDHAPLPLSLETADWGIAPTRWQRGLFPAQFRERISVIHDGIDTDAFAPRAGAEFRLPDGRVLRRGDEVVTFIARNLEPFRGFHVFMRALPEILRRRPRAQVVIAGGDNVTYTPPLPGGESYRARMLRELDGQLDLQRVHFCGWLSQRESLALLQVSAAHVYLVYPYGLSWSMLEAMAAGALVVASRTGPVGEAIEDGRNGRLVDFFSPREIAQCVDEALRPTARNADLRDQARRTVVERYDLRRICLPAQTKFLEEIMRR